MSLATRAASLALTGLLLAACKPSSELVPDGGILDSDSGTGLAAPAAAAPPRFSAWPCPPSWMPRSVARGTAVEHTACVPPTVKNCPNGEVQVVGETACRALGTCPSSGWLTESALRQLAPGFGGSIVFVQRDAIGGDGSAAKPLPSIAAALDLATAGSIIALRGETYDESVTLKKPVALVGACPAKTVLHGLASQPGQMTINVSVGGTRLANLAVAPEKGGVFIYGATGPVDLERVEIRGAKGFGLLQGKTAPLLRLKEVVIRDVSGVGLALGDGAVVEGSRVVIERVASQALLVGNSVAGAKTTITLSDVVLRDVVDSSASDGHAVRIEAPASVRLERCLLERAHNVAAVAAQGSLALSDCHLRQTLVGKLGEARGVVVFDGASAELTRVLVEEMQVAAVSAIGTSAVGPAPVLKLTDVVIASTTANPTTGEAGVGLVVAGIATGQRVLVDQATDSGILVAAPSSTAQLPALKLQLSDLAILGTRPRPKDGFRGVGLTIDSGEVSLERALLSGNRSHGMIAGVSVAGRAGPLLSLTDLAVEDTLPDSKTGLYGRGLELQTARLTLRRARLERNHDVALLLTASATAAIDDLTVRETKSHAAGAYSGLGLVVQLGSDLTARRLLLERCRGVGVQVIQPDPAGAIAKLRLDDAVIRDTERSACAALPASDPRSCVKDGVPQGGGIGLSLNGRVEATLRRFEISGSVLCGLQAVGGAGASAEDGEIHHNLIGANIAAPTDPATLLTASVRLHDNTNNIDSTGLPVPGVAAVLKGLGY